MRNDVSARDAQFSDGQWFRGKSFDGFCPVGPTLVAAADLDPSDIRVVQRLNGEVLQDARTSDLIFTIPVLVSYISAAITLEPGDLILTGTPEVSASSAIPRCRCRTETWSRSRSKASESFETKFGWRLGEL